MNKPSTEICACRACGHAGSHVLASLCGMPRFNHRLLRESELAADGGIDIQLSECESCGFVSIPTNLAQDYYDDYVNAPSLSGQARQFQMEQARDFVESYGLRDATVLEVGCGDGHFLDALAAAGAKPIGIEPSQGQRQLAQARGHHVESGFLAPGRILAQGPFAGFATRQVFEHVEDMRAFLLAIRDNLRLGAYGLVEVPNFDKLSAELRFFDVIPEHVNYFTPRTLRLVLELAGYTVLAVTAVQDGEALRADVRWSGGTAARTFGTGVEALRQQVDSFIRTCHELGKTIAIWGAGGKGLSMMAVTDLRHVRLLLDGDRAKEGLYTPVSHLQVHAPEEIARSGIDVVIVMAPAYEMEIARTLRDRHAFRGTIALAGRGVKIFQEGSFTGPASPLAQFLRVGDSDGRL